MWTFARLMETLSNNHERSLEVATIARIVVSKPGFNKNRKLFTDFITKSKRELPKGEKHQFVLLPAGFLRFPIKTSAQTPLSEPDGKAEKKEWNTNLEALKEQALIEFHRSFDSKVLKGLKAVAHYLVIGIDSKDADNRANIQFVLVFDLQSGKPLHWTGKTLPVEGEKKHLIQMPMSTHFMKKKINGKKVAVFCCNDITCFNPRHRRFVSPFTRERIDKKTGEVIKRKKNAKRDFIDETLDFRPDIVLHLVHTDGDWGKKWGQLKSWLWKKNKMKLQHFASGFKKNPPDKKQYPLSGTQSDDVMNFFEGK